MEIFETARIINSPHPNSPHFLSVLLLLTIRIMDFTHNYSSFLNKI